MGVYMQQRSLARQEAQTLRFMVGIQIHKATRASQELLLVNNSQLLWVQYKAFRLGQEVLLLTKC